MEVLNVHGFALDVHIAGTGPPLVYLHAEQFVDRTKPCLDALAAERRVIAPRHPGYGSADAPADFRSVDDLAYLYLDLLDHLDLKDVILVGASLGGWIALEMCARNHARVAKLALIGSVGVKFGDREERDFADLFFLSDNEAFPALFAAPKQWAPKYAELPDAEVEALARERQMMAYYCWRPYMHNPTLKRWLHRVQVPTLVLWGEQDRFAAPSYGRKLAESLPQAQMALIPGAGHYPQIEKSAEVARAIAAFARK